MHQNFSFLSNDKLFIFFIFIHIIFFSSCGLKTQPQNIPEIIPKPTINNFNVIQKGNRIRLSWSISKLERIKTLEEYKINSFDNESERAKVFGNENIHYQMLKKRLPKISLDLICKWFNENFDNLTVRNRNLKKWYYEQFDNGSEKPDAFSQINDNFFIQDYFIINENIYPLNCQNCKKETIKTKKLNFTSNSIIQENNIFYYYFEISNNNLFFREFEISHHGPDKKILSEVKKIKFTKPNLFPEIPNPILKIVQIENAIQTLQFPFGKIILIEPELKNSFTKNNEKDRKLLKFKQTNEAFESKLTIITLRIYWPSTKSFRKRVSNESENYSQEQNFFQTNLYRKRVGENWPEAPINLTSNTKNFFLDKIKLYINSKKISDKLKLQNNNTSMKIPFYIDLQEQNSDTWLYQIRFVDFYGNESLASKAITFNLPRNIINN